MEITCLNLLLTGGGWFCLPHKIKGKYYWDIPAAHPGLPSFLNGMLDVKTIPKPMWISEGPVLHGPTWVLAWWLKNSPACFRIISFPAPSITTPSFPCVLCPPREFHQSLLIITGQGSCYWLILYPNRVQQRRQGLLLQVGSLAQDSRNPNPARYKANVICTRINVNANITFPYARDWEALALPHTCIVPDHWSC